MSTILITGTSRGIGLELTKIFAENNWNVIACCRRPKKADKLRELAENYSNIEIYKLDVEDFDEIEALKETLKGKNIDMLLNNAGTYGCNNGQLFGNIDNKSFKETFKINTLAPLKMCETFIDEVENSNKKIMAVVTSMMGSITLNEDGKEFIYRVTKCAANMVVKCMANTLKDKKITVLAIHPGWVKTDMGGKNAPVLPEDSARGIYHLLISVNESNTGKFLDFQGNELPW
jgi:NAD(P)-dependent dehydrogenase (short-subunit alcohol dehydrogenase family)